MNDPACEECGQIPCTGPTLCYGDGINYGSINNEKRVARGLHPVKPMSPPAASKKYIVICRADRKLDGSPGDYELATRKVFSSHLAASLYAAGISSSREPIVVSGNFGQLRFSALVHEAPQAPADPHREG